MNKKDSLPSSLKNQTHLSWGNLSVQVRRLEEAGYVQVEKEFVDNKDLYILQKSNEKRDFFGRLFQKIVKKNGLGNIGYQKLYVMFKRMDGS